MDTSSACHAPSQRPQPQSKLNRFAPRTLRYKRNSGSGGSGNAPAGCENVKKPGGRRTDDRMLPQILSVGPVTVEVLVAPILCCLCHAIADLSFHFANLGSSSAMDGCIGWRIEQLGMRTSIAFCRSGDGKAARSVIEAGFSRARQRRPQ